MRILGGHSGLTFDSITVTDMSVVQFGQHEGLLRVRFLHNAHFADIAVLDFSETNQALIYQGED